MNSPLVRAGVLALLLTTVIQAAVAAESPGLIVRIDANGRPISPDLFGIFFEDLNWAADGGLYAELVQNRSFEYEATERSTWTNLTSWETVRRGSSNGGVAVTNAFPLNPNNPHYVMLDTKSAGDGFGLRNSGFDGIPVREGETYNLSLFARQHYIGDRWHGGPERRGSLTLVARLESADGAVLSEATFGVKDREWRRFSAALVPAKTDPAARLVVLAKEQGGIALDEISLMPAKTFHNRANGLRADIAQTIADLKPKFMRFPGGCLVHGNGLGNMYRWKDTIGPIEQRRQQANLWGYHQSVGLGYFEFFQFCEDIGATPLPVVPAGVCCQNSGDGIGQAGLPLEQMPAYIQDVLDLIEWANGPVTSTWGAKRAAAGHPEPFGLRYLGVGNEDQITPVFEERFRMIYGAIKAKHPEITVIGTVGPFPSGEDFDAGWRVARSTGVPMVDEHYYQSPEWFLENLGRYDAYDRNASKVYVGEYAAHDTGRKMTLRSALAEAAYLTSLERNGDIVRMASYAPLLGRLGHTQWNPDLIYFDGTRVFPSVNYQVQRLFSANSGDTCLPVTFATPQNTGTPVCISCVRDSHSGDVILKLVNPGATEQPATVDLPERMRFASEATRTILAGDPSTVNSPDNPHPVEPVESIVPVASKLAYTIPAHSVTVFRLKTQR